MEQGLRDPCTPWRSGDVDTRVLIASVKALPRSPARKPAACRKGKLVVRVSFLTLSMSTDAWRRDCSNL